MISVPASLASLVEAADDGTGRYSMSGVRLYDYDHDRWRAEASDGHVLVIVQGNGVVPTLIPEDAELMDVKRLYVVPAENWKAAFRMIPAKVPPGQDKFVNFVADDKAVMAYVLGQQQRFLQLDGRYPDIKQVLPKHPPVVRMRLEAGQLLRILRIADKLLRSDGHASVTLQWYGPDSPIGILGNANGMTLDALIVPMDLASDPTRLREELPRADPEPVAERSADPEAAEAQPAQPAEAAPTPAVDPPADEEGDGPLLTCDCCHLDADELEPVNDCDAKAIGWFCESCARTIEKVVHEVALQYEAAKAIIPPITLAAVFELLNEEWPEGWTKPGEAAPTTARAQEAPVAADPQQAPQEEKKPSLADAPDYDVWTGKTKGRRSRSKTGGKGGGKKGSRQPGANGQAGGD